MSFTPPSEEIEAFLSACRAASLSGAARATGLSQPTLRVRIAALEARIGEPLFTRTPQGLVPTARAAALLPAAEAVEAARLAFGRAAGGDCTTLSGTVRLSASRVFAAEILPPILAPFLASHPALTVELAATDRVDDLSRQDADLALRLTEPAQPALVARRLGPMTLGLHAAPGLVSELGLPADAADAAQRYPFVFEDRASRMAEGFATAGIPLPRRIALRTDDDLAHLGAIAAGIGAGVAQAGVAARRGLLRLLPEVSLPLPVWVVLHEDRRRDPRIRALADHITKALPAAA